MMTHENNYLTDDEDQLLNIAAKRTITVISDQDDDNEQECHHSHNKRHRGSSLTPTKPLTLINKSVIRNTRQTSLSIIRTSSDDGKQNEGKWNLKMLATSSAETTSKQQQQRQKKKTTRTKSSAVTKSQTPSQTLGRTISLPLVQKFEPKSEPERTRTVSFDGADLNEDDLFSQWNEQASVSSSTDTKIAQKPVTAAESKSIWKQIFSKPAKTPAVDEDLKQQWSALDKDQTGNNHRFQSAPSAGQRICPFYKKIPGTTFCVDAFNFGAIDGIQAYFLSHFHSDHYGGLNKKFSSMLYSNKITCNLCQSQLGVRSENMTILPMDVFTNIHGIDVALLDANHCPGSNMFLFRFPNGKLVLHTGDFRAAPQLLAHPLLQPSQIDTVYLDTTYCDCHYRFPSQDEVIESTVELVLETLKTNPRTLIAVGAYLIGKERIFHAIAKALDCKIFVEARKYRVLNLQENEDLSQRLTTNPKETNLHVVGMGSMTPPMLQTHVDRLSLNYTKIIGIRPTGWTTPRSTGGSKHHSIESHSSNITVYGVAYSEHSSFDELKNFIEYLKPKRIIPTVNVGRANVREKMNGYFKQWLSM